MRSSKVNLRSVALGLGLALLAGGGWSEAPTREYQVKAAFLYNFTQFVEWPAEAFAGDDVPFVIGVMGAAGQDPFEGCIEQAVSGKTVGTRPLAVRHFATLDQIEPCQLLFVPAASGMSPSGIRGRLGGRSTLIVGEGEGFLGAGGMIRFFTEDNKLRFEIRPQAAEKSGLRVSSKLLKLARIYPG